MIPSGGRWYLRDSLRDRDVEALRLHAASPSIIPPYSAGSSGMRRRSIIDLTALMERIAITLNTQFVKAGLKTESSWHHSCPHPLQNRAFSRINYVQLPVDIT